MFWLEKGYFFLQNCFFGWLNKERLDFNERFEMYLWDCDPKKKKTQSIDDRGFAKFGNNENCIFLLLNDQKYI